MNRAQNCRKCSQWLRFMKCHDLFCSTKFEVCSLFLNGSSSMKTASNRLNIFTKLDIFSLCPLRKVFRRCLISERNEVDPITWYICTHAVKSMERIRCHSCIMFVYVCIWWDSSVNFVAINASDGSIRHWHANRQNSFQDLFTFEMLRQIISNKSTIK